MLDSGSGETQINTILSELNLPVVSPTTLKCHERIVGCQMEKLAKQSCDTAVKIELELTSEKNQQ